MTDASLLQDFVAVRDEAAFEAVLRRYGPMVWRVCREVLQNPHDAEDAYQATFLVLVRNAGSIRNQDALGRWLYETSFRIAVRVRSQTSRRQAKQRQGVEMLAGRAGEDAEDLDLRPAVHAELNRLPSKLRDPILLCYFEGLTVEDAARRLQCPLGTLKGRLSRGRELLRSRLTRRGLSVSAMLLLILLTEPLSAAPAELVKETLHAGVLVAKQGAVPPTIPDRVASLVARECQVNRLRRASALGGLVVLSVGLVGLSLLLSRRTEPSGATPARGEFAIRAQLIPAEPAHAATGCGAAEPALP